MPRLEIDLGLSFALIAVFKSFLILESNGGAGSEVVEVCRMPRRTRHLGCLTQRSIAAARDTLMIGHFCSIDYEAGRTNIKLVMIGMTKFLSSSKPIAWTWSVRVASWRNKEIFRCW